MRIVRTPGGGRGATRELFARADEDGVPARMRVFRRALILDADGYQTPVFSPDGRFMAIRGNAYENSLDVFGRRCTGCCGRRSGSPTRGTRRNGSNRWAPGPATTSPFAQGSGALLVGTPRGTVVEVDLDGLRAVEHDVLGGASIGALAVLATGDVMVASRAGELVVLSETGHPTPTDSTGGNPAPDPVATFMATDIRDWG